MKRMKIKDDKTNKDSNIDKDKGDKFNNDDKTNNKGNNENKDEDYNESEGNIEFGLNSCKRGGITSTPPSSVTQLDAPPQ